MIISLDHRTMMALVCTWNDPGSQQTLLNEYISLAAFCMAPTVCWVLYLPFHVMFLIISLKQVVLLFLFI